MANVKLVNINKIYPLRDDQKKKLGKKNKEETPVKKTNLKITEKGVHAVQDCSFEIADKEFVVLVGPSGCGKSTTLRMIAGLEDITEGELYIDDVLVNSVEPKDRDIAMVFQSYALYPHMTVYDNIAYSLKLKKMSKADIDAKVREAAEILEITEYLDRKPKNLSGGQRQRVAIGRAIVRNPKVLLMDEPLSNLDAKLRNQMRAEIIKLRQKINTTFVYVTHDQVEAMTLGDRIVVMKDGCIQQIGTPQEVFDSPANLFVAGFIGTPRMNVFDAELIKEGSEYFVKLFDYKVKVSDEKAKNLAANGVESQEIILGVRPNHLVLDDNGFEGVVDVTEMMGAEIHLHTTVAGNETIAVVQKFAKKLEFSYGDKVKFGFGGDVVHIFSKETSVNLEA